MCAALCLVITLIVFPLQSQAEPAFQFHTLDKQDGMISSVVYDIAQDNDGFMWFATEDGLVKYDGFEFINYRHSRLDENSLSNNIVRSLLIDDKGRLWVGTHGGVNLYQKEYDNFKKLIITENEEDQAKANQIRALYQTSDGTIWVGTGLGLHSLNSDTHSYMTFPQVKVRAIFEDDRKQLWVGTLGDGLFKFNRNSRSFLPVHQHIVSSEIHQSNSMRAKNIIDIHQDSYGRVLVATWGGGLFQLDKDSLKLKKYKLDLPTDYIRTIHQDEENNLWFGTNEGIFVQDFADDSLRNIRASIDKRGALKSELIFSIYQSEDQTVWVGTHGGGVSKHYPQSRLFETFVKNEVTNHGLIDSVIFSMFEDFKGNVWLGSQSGGLTKFDTSSRTFEHRVVLLNQEKFDGEIWGITQVNKNTLMLGTDRGLFQYQISNNQIEPLFLMGGVNLNGEDSIAFIEKDQVGRIWVGFENSGVAVLSYSDSDKKLEVLNRIDISSPTSFFAISTSKFLVGTAGLGVFRVGLEKGELTKSEIPDTQKIDISDVSVDWNGSLWISTLSRGILKITEDGEKINLDEDVGLPNNTVYDSIPDRASGRVWATTNLGLVAIEPTNMHVTDFRYKDGIQGDEFSGAAITTNSGYIYVAGISGFSRFFPNLIQDIVLIEPAIVTELSVANEKLEISQEEGSILDRSLLIKDKLALDFDDSPFSIKFSSPQFRSPEKLRFRYRLLGLHDNWISAAAESRTATYTNISSGEYIFELQASKKGGSWSSQVETKTIVVNSPWWFTNIAKFIYALIIGSVLSLFIYLVWKKRQAELLTQKTVEESEKRLRLSLWGGGNEIWDWNIRSGEVLRSDADKNISINCSKLSRNLKELSTYIHKYDVERVKIALNAHLSGKTDFFEAAYRIKDSKLEWRWIQDRAKVAEKDENNLPIRMSGTQKDVSEIHRKDEEIERLGQAFRKTSDGVWIRDAKWRLIECNPSYEKITGFSFDEKKGEELWFPDVSEQSANIIQRIRLSLMEKGNWQGEVWAERKGNDPFPQKLTVDTILDEKGYVRYYVGVFSDITFHKRAEEEFRKLANFDALTGLPNRACLYDRLNQTIEKTRIRRERFAMFVIDIDNFKRVPLYSIFVPKVGYMHIRRFYSYES